MKLTNPLITFYLFDKSYSERLRATEGGRINVCNLFWNLIGKLIALTAATVAFCAIALIMVLDTLQFLTGVAIFVGLFLSIAAVVALIVVGGSPRARDAGSTVMDAIKLVKGKYCPQITIQE